MGSQRFGPKQIRKVSRLTGVEWEMLWNRQGSSWAGRVIEDGRCRHARIDHGDYQVHWQSDQSGHYNTCPKDSEGKWLTHVSKDPADHQR